jgi:hypothetical protein
VTHQKKEMGG